MRIWGKAAETPLTIFGAGCIAGDALYGFFKAVFRLSGASQAEVGRPAARLSWAGDPAWPCRC